MKTTKAGEDLTIKESQRIILTPKRAEAVKRYRELNEEIKQKSNELTELKAQIYAFANNTVKLDQNKSEWKISTEGKLKCGELVFKGEVLGKITVGKGREGLDMKKLQIEYLGAYLACKKEGKHTLILNV